MLPGNRSLLAQQRAVSVSATGEALHATNAVDVECSYVRSV